MHQETKRKSLWRGEGVDNIDQEILWIEAGSYDYICSLIEKYDFPIGNSPRDQEKLSWGGVVNIIKQEIKRC